MKFKVMRFRILSGHHTVRPVKGKRKRFRKGQIVESRDRDLSQIFQNKFERLQDKEVEVPDPVSEEEAGEEEEDAPKLVARRYRGRNWGVYRTDINKRIHSGWLTKKQAQDMVEDLDDQKG